LVEFAASLNLQCRNLSQSQKAIAAQACLPLLEAEAKARQIASGGDKKSELAQSVHSALNEPIKATSSVESLKNNIRASQEAGKIMWVIVDRTERLERNSGSNSQRGQVSSALPTKVQRITGKISRHIYYLNKLGLRSPYAQ
jgi:predicted lipoprotein